MHNLIKILSLFSFINVGDYNCTQTPESSFIDFVCISKSDYEQPNVIASLNTRVYGFCHVPKHVYYAWLSAPSKGEFFNENIKNRFNCY